MLKPALREVLPGLTRTITDWALNLDFATDKALPGTVTFSRASTATYFDVAGVLQTASSGTPRFDHDPVTHASLGLLIEEARTNLLAYSEEFGNAGGWSSVGDGSVTANTTTSPSGTTTADTYTQGTGSFNLGHLNVTLTDSIAVKNSIYVHDSSTVLFLRFRMSTASGSVSTFVNWTTRVFTSVGAGFSNGVITPIGGGWNRVSFTYIPAVGDGGSRQIAMQCVTASGSATSDTGKTLILWGAQLEAGAFPTSYIPTTTAAATRAADVVSMTGTNFSDWYNQAEGTFVCKWDTFVNTTNTTTRAAFGVGDPTLTFANRQTLYAAKNINAGNNNWTMDVAGVVQAGNTFVGVVAVGVPLVDAIGYKINSSVMACNGVLGNEDTTCNVPAVTALGIGTLNYAWTGAGASNNLNGTISRITYYPTRLSNTTLALLSK